nr:disease resistance-like protein DSC1 [Malus domestica]
MADSSSDSVSFTPPREKYDVFLSFRGVDTRDTFTSHLYAALVRKKIDTYIDYKLERGDKIGPALLDAIEKSKLSVVIFSKDYASSTWCLDELVHILGCKERYGQTVIPIFYGIDPSHVRKQQGSYADAFAHLEKRFKDNLDKVNKWRDALKEAADMSGFDTSSKRGTEANFVEDVVDDIMTKLNRKSLRDLKKDMVGIGTQIEQIELLLCIDSPDVCTVGIWGMGGIGKTTLAEAVFHRLTSKFEASCFLPNVREESERHGLKHLRNVLLREILNEKDLNIDTPSIGLCFVPERLSRTKALIVLDDVNDSKQLELLVGDNIRFGRGSRIIITTRDRRLLKVIVDADKIYKVEGLNCDEALQLFHLHAFKNKSMVPYYTELSEVVVEYAGGIPLALIILGSLFLHCESKEDWEDQLNELKRFPNRKIQNVLRLSYDGLEKNAKEVFLDIACFYKGMDIGFTKEMLAIRGFFVGGIKVLIDKSLLSISTRNCLEMHDLLQEMGREIVSEQCIEEPGKRNRLFIADDVCRVLKNNTGTATVECIFFNLSQIRGIQVSPAAFEKMYNLKVLRIENKSFDKKYNKLYLSDGLQSLPEALSYIYWEEYPLKALPSKFYPGNVIELRMPYSQVEKLWDESQIFGNLKEIDLCFSKHLIEVPDLSRSQKIEHINLGGCTSLVRIPLYFQYLEKLKHLQLEGCSNLKYLSEMPGNIESLNLSMTAINELPSSVWSHEKILHLDIRSCKNLKNLPSCNCKLKISGTFSVRDCSSLGMFSELPKAIKLLELTGTAIVELPSSIECLSDLIEIQLENCKKFAKLPSSICKLKSLERLDLTGCSEFECFPEISEPMDHLEFLSLERTAVKELPSSIECLSGLTSIKLNDCKRLVSLPTSICKLKSLHRLDLTGCSEFEYFPEILEPTNHLELIGLERTVVRELPSSIGKLSGLQTLELYLCKNLEFVPNSIYNLNCLKTLSFDGCLKLKELPPFSVGLCSLERLNLSYCSILEIPDHLTCITSLQDLDLSGTLIKSLPTSIKRAFQMRWLRLTNCKSLQTLPELPLLHSLEAHGCTSLKTVSSSRTALAQGWDDYEVIRGLPEELKFSNCVKLDENAWSNIMSDVLIRIVRMAIALSILRVQDEVTYDFYHARYSTPFVCPGSEIPNWFSHQNEGSSIKIKLPPDWFNTDFLGFALSVVVSFDNYNVIRGLNFGCKSNFKNRYGGSHESDREFNGWTTDETIYNLGEQDDYNFNADQVFVWYGDFDLLEGEKSSSPFPNVVTEPSLDFYVVDHLDRPEVKVKKCGIRLLYAQDSENFDVMLGGETKVEEDAKTEKLGDESAASDIFSSYKEQEDEIFNQRIRKKRRTGGARAVMFVEEDNGTKSLPDKSAASVSKVFSSCDEQEDEFLHQRIGNKRTNRGARSSMFKETKMWWWILFLVWASLLVWVLSFVLL